MYYSLYAVYIPGVFQERYNRSKHITSRMHHTQHCVYSVNFFLPIQHKKHVQSVPAVYIQVLHIIYELYNHTYTWNISCLFMCVRLIGETTTVYVYSGKVLSINKTAYRKTRYPRSIILPDLCMLFFW